MPYQCQKAGHWAHRWSEGFPEEEDSLGRAGGREHAEASRGNGLHEVVTRTGANGWWRSERIKNVQLAKACGTRKLGGLDLEFSAYKEPRKIWKHVFIR